MNIINRVIVVVGILGLLVAVTAVCLFPDFFVDQLSLISDEMDEIMSSRVRLEERLILIAVAAVADVLLLLFLVMELRRPTARAVRVESVEGGTAMLTADSIRQRVAFYVDGLEDVVRVKPRVQIRRNMVAVAVDVLASATVDVPAKAQEIVAIIRMVVTETMGLKLRGDPSVRIRIGSYKDLPPFPSALPLPVAEEE